VLAALPLLSGMLGKRAATLSGGQRQMLAVGRALMSDPHLLILDEPSAGLAPKVQDEVFAKVKAINALGVSVLMVEQRARQCLAIANHGYVLEQGRNRLEGPADELLEDPEVVSLYLGVRRTPKASPR
jgi:ABC-type branched-subunit amino acid transport system ATPase component